MSAGAENLSFLRARFPGDVAVFTLGMPQGLIIIEDERIAQCTNSAAAVAIDAFVDGIPHLTLPTASRNDQVAELWPGMFDLTTEFIPDESGLLARLAPTWVKVGNVAVRPDAIRQPIPLTPSKRGGQYTHQPTIF